MGTSPVARVSQIQHDGAALLIPGLEAAGVPGGTPVFMHHSGLLDLVTAVTAQAPILIPFRAQIIAAGSRVRVQCGTGPGVAAIGTIAAATAFTVFTLATSDAAGATQEQLAATMVTTAIIPAGSVVQFSADGGATSTGGCDIWFAYVPKAA